MTSADSARQDFERGQQCAIEIESFVKNFVVHDSFMPLAEGVFEICRRHVVTNVKVIRAAIYRGILSTPHHQDIGVRLTDEDRRKSAMFNTASLMEMFPIVLNLDGKVKY